MMNDELKKIWQSSSREEQVKFEKSRLMLEMEAATTDIHQKIKYRDWSETIAALIVIPIFIFYALTIPFLLTKIASVLIALWAVYIIFRLQKTRKQQPIPYTENYKNYLQKSKKYLLAQQALLENVLWWYVGPLFCFLLMFILGFWEQEGKETWMMTMIGLGTILSIVIVWMNKRYSENTYKKRIEKLDELIILIERE